MKEQPNALRLANWLDGAYEGEAQDAAAELRRLHGLNVELLEALQNALIVMQTYCDPDFEQSTISQSRATIAKAEGE